MPFFAQNRYLSEISEVENWGGRGGVAEKNSARTKNIRKFYQKRFHGADEISGRYTYVKVPKTVV